LSETIGNISLDAIDDTWQPVDTATLLFVRQGDEVLLIRKKRGLGAGKINGPGGKVDPGETPEQCVVREAQEELHITALDPVCRGEVKFQFTDQYSVHVFIFTATQYEGTPTETDEAAPLWFNTKEIPYREMWQDDAIWLPKVLDGKTVKGRFIFHKDTMLAHEAHFSD
jgi:8-oxo-dGTP diphosphatase